jgi:glutamate carboxypeptidase
MQNLRFMPMLSLAVLWLSGGMVAAAADVGDTERTIAAHVDAQEQPAIALLERAVNINSGSLNPGGVRRAGELFGAEFESAGFSTRWVDGAPFNRAGHLIAEHPGQGPHLLLIGHLDTVFEPSSPYQKFERVDAHTARGPGVTDNKGGIVVGLTALRALAAAGALEGMRITVVLHGDEENVGTPGELARADLVEIAKSADIAIGLENADDNPATAVTARRSSSRWVLKVTARTAHSSQIFRDDIGYGAVFELARILDSFRSELEGEEFLTFNPGIVLGAARVDFSEADMAGQAAGKSNIVAPEAIAVGDLRALTIEQREHAKNRMRWIVDANLRHSNAEITFRDNYPPMAPTAGNARLLAVYDGVSRDLGLGPVAEVDPQRAGAADIAFAAGHVAMAIDGLGLLGGKVHTPEEYADLRLLRTQARRLAIFLYRLHHGGVGDK